MQSSAPVRMLAAAVMAGGLFAATSAMAQPDGTINFSGGHVAFIGAVQWGSGTLHVHGKAVPIKVGGIGVGAIGANSFSAEGEVYHLRNVHDIVGTYTAVNASATAGARRRRARHDQREGRRDQGALHLGGPGAVAGPNGHVIHLR